MAIQVMSGLLVMKADSISKGRATVTFHPLAVSGDATLADGAVVGANTHFAAKPCASVSLRQINFFDSTTGDGHNTYFNIADSIDKDKLVVSWDAPAARIKEISFLVVGPQG